MAVASGLRVSSRAKGMETSVQYPTEEPPGELASWRLHMEVCQPSRPIRRPAPKRQNYQVADESKAVCSRSAFAWCWILSTYSVSSDRPQQQPSTAGLAVPAFGAPLPKAAQPKSTLTPTPTPEFSQGSRKRTREEIDAKDDELDQDVKRVMAEMNEKMQEILARRKRLRDERKQLYH